MTSSPRAALSRGGIVAAAVLLAGCAERVHLRVPLTRLEPPTHANRFMAGAVGHGSIGEVELTSDQTSRPPDPDAPVMGEESDALLRLDVRLAGPLAVGFRYYGDGLGFGQLKLASAPGTERRGIATAVTVGYGKGDGSVGGINAQTRYQQRWHDAGVVVGRAVGRRGLVFGGPFYTRHEYDGSFSSDFQQDPIAFGFDGAIDVAGVNLGFAWLLHSQRFIFEVLFAAIESGGTSDDQLRLNGLYEFSFGPWLGPRPAKPRTRKVRVVSPGEPAGTT